MMRPLPPKETYAGPYTLQEALEATEGRHGARIAVSCPDGAYIAVQVRSRGAWGVVRVRRLHKVSGHAGSVLGTGEWLSVDEVSASISWRPG